MRHTLIDQVQLTGKAKPCVVLDALETRVGEDPDKDYETDVKQVAATAFAGKYNNMHLWVE